MPESACPPALPTGAASLAALADRCVQCGLCLPACPTYALERIEAESPRGRIALARAWSQGRIAATPAGEAHLDHCLGCRACERACPAGVSYGALLLAARAEQRQRRRPALRQRLLETLVARPRMLRVLLDTYRRAHPLLPTAWRPLPRPPTPAARANRPDPTDARPWVAVFEGCVARAYEGPVRNALARLCEALGVALVAPPAQACCGSLHAHAGDATGQDRLGRRNAGAFAGASRVLTLASGCHEAIAAALPPGVAVDAFHYLHARGDRLRFRPLRARVALQLPCTQRDSESAAAMLALLARVPGLEVQRLDAGTGCCGAAGSRMLLDPARAAAHRQPLLDQIERLGPDRILSANIGCRLHLGNGTGRRIEHPLELLADQLATD
ncbi:(Fe-S)-binding protein [Marilutibacter spongiae]|uniref:Glycolate oxidase iron-sulfur subunit n=1 Tax=Marilutibacter spongiae TaxID=2025720 RepID=A0A7W3Y4K1_9GAMM|nr:heterodisulfide reductase-related iron-sulfur binding cluster [Lysobacter spongiae]MBB1059009.1 4Fe-4S dicluster domain-containing protein [Lysobacter spongiae]